MNAKASSIWREGDGRKVKGNEAAAVRQLLNCRAYEDIGGTL